MQVDVVIIGAGPAGLSVARRLLGLGVNFVVVESGEVAETWRRIPSELSLLNPWWLCAMNWRSALMDGAFSRKNAQQFRSHLQEFAEPLRSRIRGQFHVDALCAEPDGMWRVTSQDGTELRCRSVVCCTGYYANPAPPEPAFESDGSIPTTHIGTLRQYDELLPSVPGRVLVIGSRISAGQVLEELHRRGVEVDVSTRSPICFESNSLYRRLRIGAYYLYEPLRLALQPDRRGNSYPGMHGGRLQALIESGKIRQKPILSEVRNGKVHFCDGEKETYTRLVLATGYRPALTYLRKTVPLPHKELHQHLGSRGLQEAPGVFLFGFDNLRSLRSRYLRGIRAEASWVARDVLRFLSNKR